MKFPVIVADPPWHFQVWAGARKNSVGLMSSAKAPDYNTMRHADIANLPVADCAADDCVLLLWTCWPVLEHSLRVIEAWGFEYKTLAFDWVKICKDGSPRINLGYWTRANSEPCLLATRGKPKRLDKGVSQVLACGTGRHSEKPFEFYERTERLLEGPYLELFGRPHGSLIDGSRDGWTRLGNELTGNDMADDLKALAAL